MTRFLLPAVGVLCLVGAGAAHPEESIERATPGTTSSALERCLRPLASGGFTGSILVAVGDEAPFRRAYGDRITVDTKFHIASISKQFAAAAVLKLQEGFASKTADGVDKVWTAGYEDFGLPLQPRVRRPAPHRMTSSHMRWVIRQPPLDSRRNSMR